MPADPPLLPLLEDDLAEPGLITPVGFTADANVPSAVVICFFAELIDQLARRQDTERIGVLSAAHGQHPVYSVAHGPSRVAVFHPGVGAPIAAGFLEEVIAAGGRSFIVVGGAGALLPNLVLGHPVVVHSAVRDEGTSYHYAPPGRVIDADPVGVVAIQETLDAMGADYLVGRTWTTDAFYREPRTRIARRVDEGCLVVEMEAAAFIAVARFRGVRLGQLLYAGDSVAGAEWDKRDWSNARDVRSSLFDVAATAALRLDSVTVVAQ
ncbi:nucleoside phosphorylase [Desertihabitans aurantiacus]|uniref:nucleoside phosphorylase n=1 Tax=Desertihabitans aurantiacus TaxID=2282477 RepID=UPI0018E4E918|nr:nucleoside phosphorylase [Desertihabitans aurantiacus]